MLANVYSTKYLVEKASDDFHVKSGRSAYSSGYGNFGPLGLWELHARGCVWGLKEFKSSLRSSIQDIHFLTAIIRATVAWEASCHIQNRRMSNIPGN